MQTTLPNAILNVPTLCNGPTGRRFLPTIMSLAMIVGGSLQSQVITNPLSSASFNHQYNGDVTPLPDYTQQSSFPTAPSSDGSIMTYRANRGGGYFEATNWSVTGTTGYTIEFSVKIGTDFAEGSKGALALYYGDGSAGDIFSVGQSFVMDGNGANTISTADNTDDFHVFRVAVQNISGLTKIDMWRDGAFLAELNNGGNFNTNFFAWGSGGGVYGGPTNQVDYFRWDNTGAYAPIPEPSSLALVTGFGLFGVIYGWRRRSSGRG